MNTNQALVAVVSILGLVIVVALAKSRQLRARIQSRALGEFELQTEGGIGLPPKNRPGSPKKLIRTLHDPRPWLFRRWRVVLIFPFVLIIQRSRQRDNRAASQASSSKGPTRSNRSH